MENVAEQVVETVEEVVVTPKRGKGFAIAAGICVVIIAGRAIYNIIKAKRAEAASNEDEAADTGNESEDCGSEM